MFLPRTGRGLKQSPPKSWFKDAAWAGVASEVGVKALEDLPGLSKAPRLYLSCKLP